VCYWKKIAMQSEYNSDYNPAAQLSEQHAAQMLQLWWYTLLDTPCCIKIDATRLDFSDSLLKESNAILLAALLSKCL
jgi:hypothetical protein